ncbi:hypothetical protein VIS19158_13957 [Vibrio scophthalmi LMG 19158]|uniref:Uncharacterized protein n=1 Tax=Vibrio scophthalmi LMG 19158 TaxID=870967 RepID=F9RMN8_9VIBR|nr:hypothetical protein VIS19158_13957 [Vibrio scophthalmi LMG 19158]
MYRYKMLKSAILSLRCCYTQVGDVYANVKAINNVIRLGMPKRNTSIQIFRKMRMIKPLADLINNAYRT